LNGRVGSVAPSPDVVHRRLGDEMVLVHLQTNEIFALNETGARFWELLAAGRSRAEIESTLTAEFDVTRVDLRREIDALLTELSRKSLVQPV
jgi:Coenzyme PQQ synthesis protein D (PqqD)